MKIGVLLLPLEIQEKLQKKELPFFKVRALSRLLREKTVAPIGAGGFDQAPRTDRFQNEDECAPVA